MKTTIYLVRHGEVHNPNKVIYGRLPGFFLSETGRGQAEKLGEHLSSKTLHAIYASPLERTHETATYIHKHHGHLTIVHDERIIESYIPIEGSPIADIEKDDWNAYQPKYLDRGGESLETIWSRMQAFFTQKVREHAGETIAVVSHGDPIMISASQHAGKPLVVDSIRGSAYVETAKGFEIIFQEEAVFAVNRLEF